MDLSAALAVYDRVALKLDRVWQRMQELLPDGPFIATGHPDEVTYAELGEAWTRLAESLPPIDSWRLQADIIDYAAIGQARIDYLDIDEPLSLHASKPRSSHPARRH